MHLNEAFALRDQFGWKPAPDDETIFTVSGGDEDGFIGIDVENKNLAAEVGIQP